MALHFKGSAPKPPPKPENYAQPKQKVKIKTRTVYKAPRKLGRMAESDRAAMPKKFVVPPHPTADKLTEQALYDEQQVARVETLMLKGVRQRHHLMAALKIATTKTIDRYIDRVLARWEVMGSNKDLSKHRGEAIARLDKVEETLWSKQKGATGAIATVALMRAVLLVNQQRLEILGLTPKAIENLGEQSEDGVKLAQDLKTQQRIQQVAARMIQLIEEQKKQPPMIEGQVLKSGDSDDGEGS